MKRTKGRGNGAGREAALRLIHVLIVAALRSFAWVFSDQQGGEGEGATCHGYPSMSERATKR